MRSLLVFVALSLGLQAQCALPSTETFDGGMQASNTTCGTSNFGTYPTGWTLDPSSTNAWRVHAGSTGSSSTGPTGDHTSGTGLYLYTEASCATGSWVAILNAPCFDAAGVTQPAIEFCYHMYGAEMGMLSLQEYDGTGWRTIWSRSGDQGNQWRLASVFVAPIAGRVRVRFRGERGSGLTGDMAIDDVRFGTTSPRTWQENSPLAFQDIDGVTVGAFDPTPARVNLQAIGCSPGTPATGTLNFGSDITGSTWDTAISPLPLVAATGGGGGLTLSDGQIVNLDQSAPLSWLNGSTSANLIPIPGSTFPGAQGARVSIPFSTLAVTDLSVQSVFTDPSIPLGLRLTQGSELHVAVSLPTPVSGPIANDGSVTVDIVNAPNCFTSSGLSFFGTSYTEIHVSSNGRVVFGAPDSDGTATIAEALTGQPSVGFWTDLNPSAGGTIMVQAIAADVFRVDWQNIAFFGSPTRISFGILFDALSGEVTLDGLQGIVPNPAPSGTAAASMFLGISGGSAVGATDPGLTPFAAGTGGTTSLVTDALYDFYDAPQAGSGGLPASLLPGTLDRITFTPAGASYSWAGF